MSDMAKVPRPVFGQMAVIGAIAILALVIRIFYVHTAVVDHPLRGDAIQYFAYALNLVDHGVFSLVPPDGVAVPDGFRDPGYPTFLALLIACFGREQAFYITVLNVQCVLSAITVGIYMCMARRWFGMAGAIGIGLGLAFWPHLVTLPGYVLSETLLGFLLAAGLGAIHVALRRNSRSWALGAGIAFAAAALTSAVLAPLVPAFAGIAAWRDSARRTLWLTVLLAATLPCAAWMIRGAMLPASLTASHRIAMNFAQGSWPEYHPAWRRTVAMGIDDPASKRDLAAIDEDVARLTAEPSVGLATIFSRMLDRPAHYAGWYLSKPIELWGWEIGIGAGDVYPFPTFNSPLSGHGPLRVTTDLMFVLTPLLTLLAAIGTVATLVGTRRNEPALLLAAVCVVFVTGVFAILQSDARYAAPYRGMEFLMVMAGVSLAGHALRRGRSARVSRAAPDAN
jgi:4-amino-4-deoxy-L-arabinose transferase-like glycosyltransferase